jgi:hypothetical protein
VGAQTQQAGLAQQGTTAACFFWTGHAHQALACTANLFIVLVAHGNGHLCSIILFRLRISLSTATCNKYVADRGLTPAPPLCPTQQQQYQQQSRKDLQALYFVYCQRHLILHHRSSQILYFPSPLNRKAPGVITPGFPCVRQCTSSAAPPTPPPALPKPSRLASALFDTVWATACL